MTSESDIVIVGAGPAGLTAGLYGARARCRTLCVERLSPGGQAAVTAKVENYPGFEEPVSGVELCNRMERQARAFGLDILTDEVRSVKHSDRRIVVTCADSVLECRSLIVASGARARELGVPGEEELKGRGVSYCATCDGAFFRDQEVAVIGGGDSALEEAAFLTRFCRTVHVVHRRDEFRAVGVLVERARTNERIVLHMGTVVERIVGSDAVEGIDVRNVKSGEKGNLPVSGVFLYVGLLPNTGFLAGLVATDAQGYVVTDEEMRTSVGGVFAAGDVRHKELRQIATAVGDGAMAAMSAVRYLEG